MLHIHLDTARDGKKHVLKQFWCFKTLSTLLAFTT
jgi:hypothetical protein